jgi:sterol desaturase/sphingolipid hydroxylase (fatty acid hydroxylase superfamily)
VQIIQHADLDSRWQHHPLLAWILITPAMHRRHHERDRATSECNYGAVFSIWDRVFGTLQAPDQHVAFGVDAAASPADANWLALLRAPLRPRQSMPALRNP